MATGRVMIVDDSITVRMYHRQLLEKLGYVCDEAENGMEALEKAQLGRYDLFLVDINMPVLDGYSFVKRLRQGEGHGAPVIMVSTEAEAKDMRQSLASGANHHIIKPARPEQLEAFVKILTHPCAEE